MAEAPEIIWLQNAEDAKNQCEGRLWCEDKVWPQNEEEGEPTKYLRSDIAERQIAELLAERDYWKSVHYEGISKNKDLAKLHNEAHEAAEAENARLRALPLKDEVERVLEQTKVVLQGEAAGRTWYEQTAEALEDVDAFLSRLRAGEQEGWRSMDSAPVGVDILVGGDLGHGWKSHVYQIRDEFWREDWEDEPTHWMPLPAAPSEQGGDRG